MSKPTVHEIVSNADTIIILKNPCIEFSKWGQPAPSTAGEIWDATRKFNLMKRKKYLKRKEDIDPASLGPKGSVIDGRKFVVEDTRSLDSSRSSSAGVIQEASSRVIEQSIFGVGLSIAKQEIAIPKVIEPGESGDNKINAQEVNPVPKVTTEPIKEEGIRFCVCAGNLMSASPWFNRALKRNGWMESNWNSEGRSFYISAEDWDEEAFVILMNVFHLRNRKVPRTVTLEMLAKIAVLVDYYECDESIEPFTSVWIEDLRARTPIPKTYCRDLILWLWISWVFKLSDLFKQTTIVAIKQCTEPVRNLGLPIPAWITGMCYLDHVS